MTAADFNEKYKGYISEGFDGLEFDIPVITEMLDKKFQDLIKIEGFQYAQIKLKFNTARFYADPHEIIDPASVEDEIDKLVKLHDWASSKGWVYFAGTGKWHNGETAFNTEHMLRAMQELS